MAEYIELIDKYRIVQSKDTDYNPPSYEWVDNTGEIVRCKDCKYAERTGVADGCVWCNENLLGRLDDDFCSRAAKREES